MTPESFDIAIKRMETILDGYAVFRYILPVMLEYRVLLNKCVVYERDKGVTLGESKALGLCLRMAELEDNKQLIKTLTHIRKHNDVDRAFQFVEAYWAAKNSRN